MASKRRVIGALHGDQGENNRAGVLDQRGREVAAEGFRHARANLGAAVGSGTAPITPASRPAIQEPCDPPADAPSVAPHSAPLTMPGAELGRNLAARRGGQLVGDQLDDRQTREDPGRPRVAHEGEPASVEIEEAEPGGPAHRRRGGQRARSGDDPEDQSKSVEHGVNSATNRFGEAQRAPSGRNSVPRGKIGARMSTKRGKRLEISRSSARARATRLSYNTAGRRSRKALREARPRSRAGSPARRGCRARRPAR